MENRLTYIFGLTTLICALAAGAAFYRVSSLSAALAERDATITALSSRQAQKGISNPIGRPASGSPTARKYETDSGIHAPIVGQPVDSETAAKDPVSRVSEKNSASVAVEELRMIQENGQLDLKLGRLFSRWALSPEQLKAAKAILTERQLTLTDAVTTAHEQGIDPANPDLRTSMNELLTRIRDEYNGRLRNLIGPEKYDELKAYEQSEPERNTATTLLLRLNPTAAPLRSDQLDQLVTVLADSAAGGRLLQVQNGVVSAGISDEAVRRAKPLLSQEQFDVLLAMQREQQARSALAKLKRAPDSKATVASPIQPPKS